MPFISRTHARITCGNGGRSVQIEDLRSKNGTFVNSVAVECCDLTTNSAIRVGEVELRLMAKRPVSMGPALRRQCRMARNDLAHKLSNKQSMVCALLLEGLDESTIAARVARSFHTIHNHVRKIYEACAVHSREELLVKLLRRL